MATMKEIAARCGVSTATVSNILNGKKRVSEETRNKVLSVAEELHYFPNHIARVLRKKQTNTIGIIAEDLTVFSIPDIIDGITEYCEQHRYHMFLTNLRLLKKLQEQYAASDLENDVGIHQCFQNLLSVQVDGIIYVAGHERVIRCFPEELPVPAILAYGYSKSAKIPSVIVDDEISSRDIVRYAIAMGHRKIGVIGGTEGSIHTQGRLAGYKRALNENGIAYRSDFVKYCNWKRQAAYQNTDQLLSEGVSVIFCMSDIMAGGVYDRLNELGIRVGKEIAVLGYDNQELSSYLSPSLTTAALPLHRIGYTAASMLVQRIEKGKDGTRSSSDLEEIKIPCSIVLRQSVTQRK